MTRPHHVSCSLLRLFHPTIISSSRAAQYILSFPTNDNPLNITVVKPIEKIVCNAFRFIIITDITISGYYVYISILPLIRYTNHWGLKEYDSKEDRQVQKKVAEIMNSFYESQKAKGMNLLFVAAVGDNFYWTGQNCKEWDSYWVGIIY